MKNGFVSLALICSIISYSSGISAEPYYAKYSKGHKVFYSVISKHPELQVKDKLNGYVPEEIRPRLERRKTISTEYKLFSKEKCSEILTNLLKLSSGEKGETLLDKTDLEGTGSFESQKKYIKIKFPDNSLIMGRCSTYPNEPSRMWIEANFELN